MAGSRVVLAFGLSAVHALGGITVADMFPPEVRGRKIGWWTMLVSPNQTHYTLNIIDGDDRLHLDLLSDPYSLPTLLPEQRIGTGSLDTSPSSLEYWSSICESHHTS